MDVAATEKRIVNGIVGFLLTLGLLFGAAAIARAKQEDAIAQRSVAAVGTVSAVHMVGKAVLPTLRFHSQDGRVWETPAAAGIAPELLPRQEGGPIRLRYDAQNPREAWVEGSRTPLLPLLLATLSFGAIALSIGAALLYRLVQKAGPVTA